jgi:Domain of unknown function (DUF2760)
MVPYGTRLKYAFRTFFSILDRSRIPDDVLAALHPGARVGGPALHPSAQTTRAGDPALHSRPQGTSAGGAVAAPEPTKPAPPPKQDPVERATQMLALLQRDGRLIDFLMEDLAPYADSQIGAAVRDVHGGCRQALDRYFTLRPVLDDEEGRPVTIERGMDAASIKIVGNVTGQPPLRGVLRHRGWEATRIELPPLPATGHNILAPAEVEVT